MFAKRAHSLFFPKNATRLSRTQIWNTPHATRHTPHATLFYVGLSLVFSQLQNVAASDSESLLRSWRLRNACSLWKVRCVWIGTGRAVCAATSDFTAKRSVYLLAMLCFLPSVCLSVCVAHIVLRITLRVTVIRMARALCLRHPWTLLCMPLLSRIVVPCL